MKGQSFRLAPIHTWIYIRETQLPLCNHCYSCKSNSEGVSLLNLYIDDLSPSENATGSVWSIETCPHPRRLWLPLNVLYFTAFVSREIYCFPQIPLLYTICDLFSLSPPLFGFALPSLLLHFESSSPGPRFLSHPPLIYFSLSRINALQEACVFLPLHHNIFMMCPLCGLLVRVAVSTVEEGWVG